MMEKRDDKKRDISFDEIPVGTNPLGRASVLSKLLFWYVL